MSKGKDRRFQIAASSRAAEISAPLTFASFSTEAELQLDGQVSVIFKKLGKRDAATRIKASTELFEYTDSCTEEQLGDLVAALARVWQKYISDVERRVRELFIRVLSLIIDRNRKLLGPQLEYLVPCWLLARFDLKEISQVAIDSFNRAFPSKATVVLEKYIDSILETFSDYLFVQTADTLSDSRFVDEVDRTSKYQRVVSSSLNALAFLQESIPRNEKLATFLLNPQIYQFFYSEMQISRAALLLIQSIALNSSNFKENMDFYSQFIFSHFLKRSDEFLVLQLTVIIARIDSNVWLRHKIWSKLLDFLKKSPTFLVERLSPLFIAIIASLPTESSVDPLLLLDCLLSGDFNSASLMDAYYECIVFLLKNNRLKAIDYFTKPFRLLANSSIVQKHLGLLAGSDCFHDLYKKVLDEIVELDAPVEFANLIVSTINVNSEIATITDETITKILDSSLKLAICLGKLATDAGFEQISAKMHSIEDISLFKDYIELVIVKNKQKFQIEYDWVVKKCIESESIGSVLGLINDSSLDWSHDYLTDYFVETGETLLFESVPIDANFLRLISLSLEFKLVDHLQLDEFLVLLSGILSDLCLEVDNGGADTNKNCVEIACALFTSSIDGKSLIELMSRDRELKMIASDLLQLSMSNLKIREAVKIASGLAKDALVEKALSLILYSEFNASDFCWLFETELREGLKEKLFSIEFWTENCRETSGLFEASFESPILLLTKISSIGTVSKHYHRLVELFVLQHSEFTPENSWIIYELCRFHLIHPSDEIIKLILEFFGSFDFQNLRLYQELAHFKQSDLELIQLLHKIHSTFLNDPLFQSCMVFLYDLICMRIPEPIADRFEPVEPLLSCAFCKYSSLKFANIYVKRISSISNLELLAFSRLALKWKQLDFGDFGDCYYPLVAELMLNSSKSSIESSTDKVFNIQDFFEKGFNSDNMLFKAYSMRIATRFTITSQLLNDITKMLACISSDSVLVRDVCLLSMNSKVDQSSLESMVTLILNASNETHPLILLAANSLATNLVEEYVQEQSLIIEMSRKQQVECALPSHIIKLFDLNQSTPVFSLILGWLLLLSHFKNCTFPLKQAWISELKQLNQVNYVLEAIFEILDLTRKPFNLDLYDISEFHYNLIHSVQPNQIQLLASHLYYQFLVQLPSLVRNWWSECKNRGLCLAVERYTEQYFSPQLIANEMQIQPIEGLAFKINKSTNEVMIMYLVEDSSLDVIVKMSLNYPLRQVEVSGGSHVGVTESRWRGWLLATASVMTVQNGSIGDAMVLLKKNLDLHFEGVEDCAICYSVIGLDHSLPSKKCKTCKHLFHGSCLFKWFKSSSQSTCPLCRSLF